ncbi:CPBP family glutamic-type intramembrane protease [Halorussus halophilus]|uniref:CPBP family glutamic-type intramembrane protease n=1 Tax=Halorussus halophilus TaxID=2650975 RepID=UPI0034A4FB5D
MVGPFVGKMVLLGSLFVTSVVFGFVYERTRNLLVNAVVHGAYNATLLVLAYVVFSMGLA